MIFECSRMNYYPSTKYPDVFDYLQHLPAKDVIRITKRRTKKGITKRRTYKFFSIGLQCGAGEDCL